jgi:hypothetical protein
VAEHIGELGLDNGVCLCERDQNGKGQAAIPEQGLGFRDDYVEAPDQQVFQPQVTGDDQSDHGFGTRHVLLEIGLHRGFSALVVSDGSKRSTPRDKIQLPSV